MGGASTTHLVKTAKKVGKLRDAYLSSSVLSVNPTGVDHPDVTVVLLDLFGQHFSVETWVSDQERLSVASRENWFRLNDSNFGTSHLTGVTGNEVVHGLLTVELGHWWEHSVSITSQEDDVLWVSSDRWDLGVWNEFDWVGHSGVWGDGNIVKVDLKKLAWLEYSELLRNRLGGGLRVTVPKLKIGTFFRS